MIDRFVFITDSHWKAQNVESRKDDYAASLFRKLKWVVGFCKKRKVENLIHGGDLLDNPNISDKIAGKIAKILTNSGLNLWYVIGNHDITGKNPKTYVNGKLHLFESYPWFHFIGGRTIEFSNCVLSGCDYTKEKECDSAYDMEYRGDKFKVLVIHDMITGDARDFMVGIKRVMTSYRSIDTDADLILTGHYHPGYGIKKLEVLNKTRVFANPGAFARTANLKGIECHGPALIYFLCKNNKLLKIEHVRIPCKKNIFKKSKNGKKYTVSDMLGGNFMETLSKFKNAQEIMDDLAKLVTVMLADKEMKFPFEVDGVLEEYLAMKITEAEQC